MTNYECHLLINELTLNYHFLDQNKENDLTETGQNAII